MDPDLAGLGIHFDLDHRGGEIEVAGVRSMAARVPLSGLVPGKAQVLVAPVTAVARCEERA